MVKYVTADELAELMRSDDKTPKKDYLVVDVRGEDFTGGNIVGCRNQPSDNFNLTVHGLVRETKDVPLVIFHCALSQVRGPKAARIYEETRKNLFPEEFKEGEKPKQEVAVLFEGFTRFQQKFRDDPDLVENWDPSYWNEEWS